MSRPLFLLDTNTCIYIINRRPLKVFDHFVGLTPGETLRSPASPEPS